MRNNSVSTLDAMFADLKIKEKESNRYKIVRKPKRLYGKPLVADGWVKIDSVL